MQCALNRIYLLSFFAPVEHVLKSLLQFVHDAFASKKVGRPVQYT